MVYYNINVISSYETKDERLNFKENYERKFKQFEAIDRLYVTSKKTNVALYPMRRMYAVEADYTLKNKSAHALTELFITERLPLERITIENARLVSYDSIYGTYLFQYHTPLQPNDSLKYTFELKKEAASPLLSANTGLVVKDFIAPSTVRSDACQLTLVSNSC